MTHSMPPTQKQIMPGLIHALNKLIVLKSDDDNWVNLDQT